MLDAFRDTAVHGAFKPPAAQRHSSEDHPWQSAGGRWNHDQYYPSAITHGSR